MQSERIKKRRRGWKALTGSWWYEVERLTAGGYRVMIQTNAGLVAAGDFLKVKEQEAQSKWKTA